VLEQTESLEQLRALYQGISIVVELACESNLAGVDTEADIERVEQWFLAESKRAGLAK
jgi:3-deoxy-manno-octulosonate cytidylyltransferase (CMP-KDO synthetase)